MIIMSLLAILSYVISVLVKNKMIVPRSVSATFYILDHPRWFKFSMIFPAIILIPAIIELSIDRTQSLAFLAMLGMILVGFSPDYKNDKNQRIMHYAGAFMLLLGTQIWVLFNMWEVLFVWILYVLYILIHIVTNIKDLTKEKILNSNPMFWAEMCIINIFMPLFIKTLG